MDSHLLRGVAIIMASIRCCSSSSFSIVVLGLLVAGALSVACAADPETGSDSHDVNAAPACNPLPIKTSANIGNVTGLEEMPGTPLPSLGPDANGFFHPAAGYSEGGTFPNAADESRWRVEASEIAPRAPAGKLRVIEWNVERGNKLDKAIKLMKKLNGDVWLINESDLYGKNSGGVVVAREIARALGYSYYTAIEFYERRDDRRGTSGNAIISRFPLTNTRSLEIPQLETEGGHDWSVDNSEPRCGQRAAHSATIMAPTASGGTLPVNVVALHTENKANANVRMKQFDHVVRELVRPGEPTILAGDLNTVSGGEGPALRVELQRRVNANGRDKALFDCSRGDDTTTFSAAFIVNLRLDWVMVQGATAKIDCAPGGYKVKSNDGASDHKPVVVEMTVAN
jgi:endonuclease/exonuclease/phosphatase family metal-dependent hydrolase